jgi:hypothetical protein
MNMIMPGSQNKVKSSSEKIPPSPLQAELLPLVRLGWPLVPIYPMRTITVTDYSSGEPEPVDLRVCSCHKGQECTAAGKHTMTNWRQGDEVAREPKDLLTFFPAGENRGAAVLLGEPGLCNLDIDERHGGDKTLATLLAEHGPLPLTAEERRGGASPHYYFRMPAELLGIPTKVELAPGVDFISQKHVVITAPSEHASGQKREWVHHPVDVPPAELPTWVIESVLAKVEADKRKRQDAGRLDATAYGRPGASHGFAVGGKPVPPALHQGERNNGLFKYGCSLQARGYDDRAIEELLFEANVSVVHPSLDKSEVLGILSSVLGYAKGERPARRIDKPARCKDGKGDRPKCPPEELCVRRRRKLVESLGDGSLHAWCFRCGTCDPCMIRKRRRFGEEFETYVTNTSRAADGLYIETFDNKKAYQTRKKQARRMGGGGVTGRTPGRWHIVTNVPVDGATRVDAAGAEAFWQSVVAEMVPLGRGRRLTDFWGAWRRPKAEKKPPAFRVLMNLRQNLEEIQKIAAELGIETGLSRADDDERLWQLSFFTDDEDLKLQLIEELSKRTLMAFASSVLLDNPAAVFIPGDAWEPPPIDFSEYDAGFYPCDHDSESQNE